MWNFFLDNKKFTYVILVALVILGLLSINQIPKESNPEIDIPVIVISTVFPGASAIDVEELITTPIEDKLLSLSDVDDIQSISRQNISMITVNFDVNSDSNEKLADLKDKIDQVKSELPSEAEEPNVKKISFSDRPILTLSISGPYELTQLKDFATTLQDKIERVSGVSQVNIIGGLEREISVVVDKKLINQQGISLNSVTRSIRQANSDIPIGSIENNNEEFLIRFSGRIDSSNEIGLVPVATNQGTPLLVRDIAQVVDKFSEPTSISRLSVDGNPSQSSVSLKIFKVSGGNVLSIIDEINESIKLAQIDFLPPEVIIKTTEDGAEKIRTDLGDLSINALETVLIITLLLFLFLGWKEAILAALSIPLTFLITFFVLSSAGYTLNMLTLFSLILSLGILVDSAIVITEAMHNSIKSGKTSKQSAFSTINEYKLPLTTGTLTTIFAFLPMMFTSGIIGKFIKSIPITVGIVLITSLFVALGIITVIGMDWLKKPKIELEESKTNKDKFKWRKNLILNLENKHQYFLQKLLSNKKISKKFLATLSLLLLMSLLLPISGILKINMFPVSDENNFFIDIELPIGTTLNETDRHLKHFEHILQEDNRIESFVINAGSNADAGSILEGSSIKNNNLGHFIINLKKKRKVSSSDIVLEYQKTVKEFFSGTIVKNRVTQRSSGPGDSAPIEIIISGNDLETLDTLSTQLFDVLKSTKGTVNVKNSLKESNGEFVLSIDRAKARIYGLSTSQIAETLRNAVFGVEATTLKTNKEEIDVIVKYQLDEKNIDNNKTNNVNIGTISSLLINTPSGDIPLSNFIKTSIEGGQTRIKHKEGNRIISLTSYTKKGTQAQEVLDVFQKNISNIYIPEGYSISFGGEREDIKESFNDLFRSMILGILLIAALLVWQFRSFIQPLFILVTIPLSLIGVLPGLLLVNQPLSFPGFIGIVALAGIVVNNAIILIDRINQNRITNPTITIKEAITEATKSRLQPIVLTTITTVTGILPLAISNPTWGPLGYSIVFGLLFSTILTLFVVPVLYMLFEKNN